VNDSIYEIKEYSKQLSASGMRRKVARKRDGSSHIFDESTTNVENELSDITLIEEKNSKPTSSRI